MLYVIVSKQHYPDIALGACPWSQPVQLICIVLLTPQDRLSSFCTADRLSSVILDTEISNTQSFANQNGIIYSAKTWNLATVM